MTDNPLLVLVQQQQGDEDPRFSDAFAQLRAEVEKLSGNDFERIAELSETILTEQAVDLRVLAYLGLAQTFLRGAAGLHQVLETWNWVVENRWDQCFPQRERARLGAANWFKNERFLSFLQRDEAKGPELERLVESLRAFHSGLQAHFGEEQAPRLKEILGWLKEQQAAQQRTAAASPPPAEPTRSGPEKAEPAAPAEVTPSNSEPASASVPSATAPSSTAAGIDSEKAEQKALRELLAWYRQERRFEPLVALARVMRWSTLILPPAEKGVTRLPAPRPASLNAVSSALERQQWEEALLASERAFIEPGGQFCMQIQFWSHQSATALGLSNVAACIEREVRQLFCRHRDLVKLRFSNNEPFVAGEAANWIESLLQSPAEGAQAGEEKWQQLALEAAAINKEKGLVAGLALLDEVPTRGRRERSEQDLLKAELCLSNQRQDLALPLLEAVAERLDDHGIAAWEPPFALRVWRLLQQALRAQQPSDFVEQRLAQISQCISRTDVTAAAAML